MGAPLPLRFQDPDEAEDPEAISPQVIVPASGELRRVQVGLVGDREEQAMIAAPMLDEGFDVEPQLKRRLGVSAAGAAPAFNSVAIELIPNGAVVAGSAIELGSRDPFEAVNASPACRNCFYSDKEGPERPPRRPAGGGGGALPPQPDSERPSRRTPALPPSPTKCTSVERIG
jgi:hypothetical protein